MNDEHGIGTGNHGRLRRRRTVLTADCQLPAANCSVHVGTDADVPAGYRFLRTHHLAYVGPAMFARYLRDGGYTLYRVGGELAAVSLMAVSRGLLVTLCVGKKFRGRGVGGWVVDYLVPNFVRAAEPAVPFFAARGYTPIGDWLAGRKLRTRVMVRSSLIGLAGRLREVFGDGEETDGAEERPAADDRDRGGGGGGAAEVPRPAHPDRPGTRRHHPDDAQLPRPLAGPPRRDRRGA
jgi:hypothetical protein